MKVKRVHYENFRILRDLELEFSTDPERRLTVIRAENETGKTTMLTGLQWALYGEKALPGKGKDFRLHPIDWNSHKTKRVSITVTVDFEHTMYLPKRGGDFDEETHEYKLIRTVTEEIEGTRYRRGKDDVELFMHIDQKGYQNVDHPENLLEEILPENLKEVFFTDGDRALSFIEADTATKRKKVEQAIRSLLGLEVLENSISHVDQAAKGMNKEIGKDGTDSDLSKVEANLEELELERSEFQQQLDEASEQLSSLELKIREVDKEIEAALRKGDKEQLMKELQQNKQEIKKFEEDYSIAEREHTELFRNKELGSALIATHIKKAASILENLKTKGTIPSSTIPVLKERLSLKECICGGALDPSSQEGRTRRKHIEALIEAQEKDDEIRSRLTELFYSIKEFRNDSDEQPIWCKMYRQIQQRLEDLRDLRDKANEKKRNLELKLDALKDDNIEVLRNKKRTYENSFRNQTETRVKAETHLNKAKAEIDSYEKERDKLLRKQGKYSLRLSQLEVTQDIKNVLRKTFNAVLSEELQKVSDEMNHLFIQMIGSDPEQGAIIHSAQITKDFDIQVLGPQQRMLDPDRDLNGASRRALTLAFVLALAEVSGVEGPNIIDTPLGMMSGYVKLSVLKTTHDHSRQLVMFLTRSEIESCEDIIDQCAGITYTLTNPVHYPMMLKNKLETDNQEIVKCSCSHREICDLCERIGDSNNESLQYISLAES